MAADVTQSGSTKQGVNYSVSEHIGVTPAVKPLIKGYLHPPDN
jgi:hypothetical protein